MLAEHQRCAECGIAFVPTWTINALIGNLNLAETFAATIGDATLSGSAWCGVG